MRIPALLRPRRRSDQRRDPPPCEQVERICLLNLLAGQEVVFFKDLEGRFVLVSDGFLETVANGRRREEVIGKTDFDLFREPHPSAALADEQRIIRTGEPMIRRVERLTYHDRPEAWVSVTKMPLRDDEGRIVGTFGIARDITEQQEVKERLAHQALHDPMTGLANRTALMDHLERRLSALERQPGHVALLFIDLDDFKDINDSCGHQVGDEVITEVSRRLVTIARRNDTVARMGGDEFVLLFQARHGDDLKRVAERVVRTVSAPLKTRYRYLNLGCSVGGALSSDSSTEPSDLLRQADLAMYAAKRSGGSRFALYDPRQHGRAASKSSLANDLARAVGASEFVLHYQPIWRLDDGAMIAVEALVRWQHPIRGLLTPGEFIEVAEQHGLIGAIDGLVIDAACRQLAAWSERDPRLRDLTVAVNVSGRELQDEALAGRVRSALERHRLAASRLCLEVTESALITRLGAARDTLACLANLGVAIALDDFGTGYSTLAHIQQLPADVVKLDRTFVAQLDQAERSRKLLGGVIAMAHALGMTVIAEGVERGQQMEVLLELECDAVQGYLCAAPQSADEIAASAGARLRNRHSEPPWRERPAA